MAAPSVMEVTLRSAARHRAGGAVCWLAAASGDAGAAPPAPEAAAVDPAGAAVVGTEVVGAVAGVVGVPHAAAVAANAAVADTIKIRRYIAAPARQKGDDELSR
jgi:hypothetical protein